MEKIFNRIARIFMFIVMIFLLSSGVELNYEESNNQIDRKFNRFDPLEFVNAGNIIQEKTAWANKSETVKLGEYEEMTSSNGMVDRWGYDGELYKSQKILSNTTFANDSLIVNIIPKKMFKTEGAFSYIGYDYGFLIKTTKFSEEEYRSK